MIPPTVMAATKIMINRVLKILVNCAFLCLNRKARINITTNARGGARSKVSEETNKVETNRTGKTYFHPDFWVEEVMRYA